METSEANLARALRQLAVALPEAQDLSVDPDTLVRRFGAAWSPTQDPELVEDALIAAGLLLAGSDPHLSLLAAVWGTADLRDVIEEITRALRRAS